MAPAAFGGYQIVEQIGRGAAGTVFVAEHGRLRHQVAIKVLHPHLVGDPWEQRMLTEADVLSRIDHPGIVKVFDLGVADDGRAFVVMEHLVGESLHARLRRARVPEERVVAFARQLASALGAAHAAGVVHRDLKPENVFVVRDPALPGGERVKLLDFGVAKRKGTNQTATGIVLGTPAYMAPEQFMVGSRHVDPRSDVYSLGVLLYQMATGTRPFEGRDTDELLAEHAYCKPAPASAAGAVSRRLSAIIERCLAKHPDDRFATMAELGAELGALEAAAPAARRLEDVSTLVFVTLDDGAADATTNVLLGSQELDIDPITNLIPVPAPAPPHARIAGRSARWVLALAAAAAAAAALALGYSLGPSEAVANAAEAPAPDKAGPSGDPTGASHGPIEMPAIEALIEDTPASPVELTEAIAGGEPALPVTAVMPAAAARSAASPGASAPARAPRLRVRPPDTSRKPAKERSYATVSPPTLF